MPIAKAWPTFLNYQSLKGRPAKLTDVKRWKLRWPRLCGTLA